MKIYKIANNANKSNFSLNDVQISERETAGGQRMVRFEIPNVAEVELGYWKNMLILDDMEVNENYRRMGIGSLLLTAVKNYADKVNLKVNLTPSPYEPEKMSYEDLSGYYSKNDFVPVGKGEKPQFHEYHPNMKDKIT
jgi:GNAT superfamily N-acetyltransferase